MSQKNYEQLMNRLLLAEENNGQSSGTPKSQSKELLPPRPKRYLLQNAKSNLKLKKNQDESTATNQHMHSHVPETGPIETT